jgi:hypothetical protein
MSRNKITKDEIKCYVLKQKHLLNQENISYTSDPKSLANKYLNNILEKLNEFRF